MNKKKTLFSACMACLLVNLSAETLKRDTTRVREISLNEVVVKAGKQNLRLADMPVAVTYIGAKQIEQKKMTSIRNLTAIVPNFFMPEYGSKLTAPVYIRGIGSRINNPSIGLYVDNVPYFEKGAFVFDFVDVERIEVLRGPQGTIYGRNTMGGIINVITRQPNSTPRTDFSADFGNYNLQRYRITRNQPLIPDKLAMLVSAGYSKRDGYFTNQFTNSKIGDDETYNGSVKLRYTPLKQLELVYKAGGESSHENGYPYGLLNSTGQADISYNGNGQYTRKVLDNSLSVGYNLNHLKVSSVSSFQYLNDNQDVDQDFSSLDYYQVIQKTNQHLYSQELNISTTNYKHFELSGGFFGFSQEAARTLNTRLGTYNPAKAPNYDKYNTELNQGLAGYSQASLKNLLGFIDLSAGIRFDFEHNELAYKYDIYGTNNTIKVKADTTYKSDFSQWMPRFSARFKTSKNTSLYGVISKGYKGGGFNISFTTPDELTYKPEYSWNYEVGFKGSFFDKRLTTNLNGYYIDWKDQQISKKVTDGKGYVYRNAGHSTSKGVEAEVIYRPCESFMLGGSFGLTWAKFDEYKSYNASKLRVDTCDGNFLPYVPRNTFSVYTMMRVPLRTKILKSVRLNTTFQGVGRIYWDDLNTQSEKPYTLLNQQLTFEFPWFEAELWGKNMLDTKYHPYSFSSALVGGVTKWYGQQGVPATFGVTLRAGF